ncbi:MAG: Hint domain-containing protein [Pseudomonadota bacterium]
MPYLYIYSPDDFVGGLPAEAGAQADGTGPFTLTLKPGAKPTLVEVSDDDLIFDEVDGSQTLAGDIDLDGEAFAAGTSINTAYDLIDTASGHRVTSFHFGGDGYQQGAVDGLVSTEPLLGGESYTFNQERTSHQQANQYDDYFACFADDTLIDTPYGPRPVETLHVGDLVITRDAGPQPVRLVLRRSLSAEELAAAPALVPIKITGGALGPGVPDGDLWVSPQHRMMVNSRIAERMFGRAEALVAAHRLVGLPGIAPDPSRRTVTYVHLVLDAHHVIRAEGAWSETFLPGPMGLAALDAGARAEIQALFPDLSAGPLRPARPIPTGRRQSRLIERHMAHHRPLQMPAAIA